MLSVFLNRREKFQDLVGPFDTNERGTESALHDVLPQFATDQVPLEALSQRQDVMGAPVQSGLPISIHAHATQFSAGRCQTGIE